jgi:hypothetical protein
LEQLKDNTAKDWLTNHTNWENATRPLTLGNFLPPIFDCYIAVLWTPGLIDNFPFDKINQPPFNIEQTNSNVKIWKEYNLFLNEETDDLYRPTTFAELSSIFNFPYNKEIINALPWQTEGIKTLFYHTRKRLERIVDALAEEAELNVYIEDYYRWTATNSLVADENVSYKISCTEFLNLMDDTSYDANLYLYSFDKSWCLINMEDLGFNIIAYKYELAEKINQLNLADTFKLQYDDILFN